MRLIFVATMIAVTGCVRGSTIFQREPAEEALYRRALVYLDPANPRGSLDSAAVLLDRYVASGVERRHVGEALAIRRLIDQAQELQRVEVVIQNLSAEQRRADAEEKRDTADKRDSATKRSEPARPRPSAEAAREIQRLRDELKAANAELERIRKRLTTTPNP